CDHCRGSSDRQQLLVDGRDEHLDPQVATKSRHGRGKIGSRCPRNLMATIGWNGGIDRPGICVPEMEIVRVAKQSPDCLVSGTATPGEENSHSSIFPVCPPSSAERRSINRVYRRPAKSTKAGYRSLSTTLSKSNCSA